MKRGGKISRRTNPSAAWDSQRTSPASRCSWLLRTRPSSPAKRLSWMAVTPRYEAIPVVSVHAAGRPRPLPTHTPMKSGAKRRRVRRHHSDLVGKVALVTGGASGIGRECVRILSSAGARVVVADVDDRRGEELVAELARSGAV